VAHSGRPLPRTRLGWIRVVRATMRTARRIALSSCVHSKCLNGVVPPILNNLDELAHRLAVADQRLVRVRRYFDQLFGRSGRRQPGMARFQVAADFGYELTEGFARPFQLKHR